MNKLAMLKLEDRNTVRDNLDAIMDRVRDLIADKYMEDHLKIEIDGSDITNFEIDGIDRRCLYGNLDLVYGAMIEAGYNVELFSDDNDTWIKVSV